MKSLQIIRELEKLEIQKQEILLKIEQQKTMQDLKEVDVDTCEEIIDMYEQTLEKYKEKSLNLISQLKGEIL